jgi:hypothetical protein
VVAKSAIERLPPAEESNSQLKLKIRRREMENATRDEDETRWRQRYGKRRTYVSLVSLERGPINLLLVQLDQAPVFGETVGLDRDLDPLQSEACVITKIFRPS